MLCTHELWGVAMQLNCAWEQGAASLWVLEGGGVRVNA